MGDSEADRNKAMAAIRAMFEKYMILAEQRPKDHIVSLLFGNIWLPLPN
jgi:acyl-coenzyme A thioesterase 13